MYKLQIMNVKNVKLLVAVKYRQDFLPGNTNAVCVDKNLPKMFYLNGDISPLFFLFVITDLETF